MSDIGPIAGLGALIIFIGLLLVNSTFLIISTVFLLIEKRQNKRIIKFLNAKGLFVSTLIVEIILFGLILFIDNSDNNDILNFLDLSSPVVAVTILAGLIIVNVRYSRQHREN